MARGRPSSSARVMLPGGRGIAKLIHNRQRNPGGYALKNTAIVAQIDCETGGKTIHIESDLATVPRPGRPAPRPLELELTSRGLRGEADSAEDDGEGSEAPQAKKELKIVVKNGNDSKVIGWNVLEGDLQVKSIRTYIEGCTFQLRDSEGGDRDWTIELACMDVQQARQSKNFLQHLRSCCENLSRTALEYTNVTRSDLDTPRYRTRLSVTQAGGSKSSTIMAGREGMTFTGFYHRNIGLVQDMLLESETRVNSEKRTKGEWKKKKGQAKRAAKNTRRAQRKASGANDKGSETATASPEKQPVSGHESDEAEEVRSEALEEDMYEVEMIVGKRRRNGVFEYRIRWAGWSAKHDSWEAAENLESVQEMITEYEQVD